jgi:DNA-binding beta-propeller fold protein YncE
VVERIAVGRGAAGLAVGAGSVWVANALDGTVSRIDPRRGEVVETIEVGGLLQDVAVGAGGVWVTADAG